MEAIAQSFKDVFLGTGIVQTTVGGFVAKSESNLARCCASSEKKRTGRQQTRAGENVKRQATNKGCIREKSVRGEWGIETEGEVAVNEIKIDPSRCERCRAKERDYRRGKIDQSERWIADNGASAKARTGRER